MPSNRFPMGTNIKEYLTGDPLKTLKNDLNSGIKSPNCDWCWKNEENNLKTHRITEKRGSALKSMHIRLNNVCNFKCRMCNPSFSSTWAQENKKHKYFVYEDNKVTKDAINTNGDLLFSLLKKNIRAGNLSHISLSGGEPLITDANYKLLTFLIDNNLTNINISYSTNLSNLKYKNIDLLELWKPFNNVELEASIDGWGAHAEYSRHGLVLKDFLNNFKAAFKHVKAINCVVNLYSVWTLPFIEKFKKHNIRIIYSPCYLPAHCNPQILMREDKEELRKLYAPYPELLSVFKNFIDKEPDLAYDKSINAVRKEMIYYNLLLDEHRGTDFFKTFPIYRKYEN
jgi:organic radical activating enzyme